MREFHKSKQVRFPKISCYLYMSGFSAANCSALFHLRVAGVVLHSLFYLILLKIMAEAADENGSESELKQMSCRT